MNDFHSFATYDLIRKGEGIYRLQSTDGKTGVGRVYATMKLSISQARQQAKVDGVELLVCD